MTLTPDDVIATMTTQKSVQIQFDKRIFFNQDGLKAIEEFTNNFISRNKANIDDEDISTYMDLRKSLAEYISWLETNGRVMVKE